MNIEVQRVIESLRLGIPPDGQVRYFTVGRLSEITELTARLQQGKTDALLLKANYGSGKSHLLRFIRETALKANFAVSSVTLDAKSAVRFNRMDQMLGAIWRGLEIPNNSEDRGVRPFFDWVCEQARESKGTAGKQWQKITNNGQWDFSQSLESPAIFIALRAWMSGRVNKDLVEDLLFQKSNYKTQHLYQELIHKSRMCYRKELELTRTIKWQNYTTKALLFDFKSQGYAQSWAAIRDIHTLACASGMRGIIILFDEFEDVLSNITNIAHQEMAFQNLFQFFAGQQFQGMSFFAVTPEFVSKCRNRLISKGRWDYDYAQLDALSTFEMSPLEISQLQELTIKIKAFHGIAYGWDTNSSAIELGLTAVVKKTGSIAVQDRTRQTIKEVVKFLDRQLEEIE
ncbi:MULTISPECIES: BREX system ATP-binding domain-containing protein [unclassified Microcoleus]|uniref:BREX system ATP-binding domain-containing protein n=1 Tax=unclassified Microcoleus TaxID=2642155 RepID=UPI002FD06929